MIINFTTIMQDNLGLQDRDDAELQNLRPNNISSSNRHIANTSQIDVSNVDSLNNTSSLNLSRDRSKTQFDGFSLRFEDLIIWVPEKNSCLKKREEKDILKGISARIPKGNMTAIIGPSGSGKTTLMNYLSGRQNESQMFRSYCNYYINGAKIDNVNRFKNIIGYVLQDDIMETSLTPRQLFTFYSKLRGLSNIKEKAKDIISLMSLDGCADTKVGDVFKRGISGGERKRTNIGIELVSDPNLLFLDEPTTGLDSATALDVMRNLADLKSRGITIVSTIHAPSKDILELFDQVIILVDGKLVFDGKPTEIADRLGSLNMKVPRNTEPIEYFMKIIDKDDLRVEFEKEGKETGNDDEILIQEYDRRVNHMVDVQSKKTVKKMLKRKKSVDNLENLVKIAETKNRKLSKVVQFWLLFKTNLFVFFNDIYGIIIKSLIFWIITILLIIVFVDLGNIENETLNALQNRAGVAFMLTINYFFIGANLTSTLFISRKQIFLKDKQARIYDDGPFFFATQLYTMPFFIINFTISFVILYFSVRLNNDPAINFLWYWLFIFLGSFLGGGAFGMLMGVIAQRIETLGALVPALVLPQLVVAGYFAAVETMVWPLYIYSFVSPARYTFQGIILTEFSNRERYVESCNMTVKNDAGEKNVVPVPDEQTNRCDPFNVFDFEQDTKWLNLVIVIVINIALRTIAFIAFKFKYGEKDAIEEENKEKIEKYSLKTNVSEKEEFKNN